jgi:hypothetical protein
MNAVNGLADFVGRDAADWSRYRDETDYSAAMFGERPTKRYGSTHDAARRALEDTQNITVSVDPANAMALTDYNRQLQRGFADPGLANAQEWEKFLHPEQYPKKSNLDVTPGDDGKNNPYGIDVNELLRWAYSQLGYHEKASNEDLYDKFANIGGNTDNWTKFGEWYDKYNNTSGFNHEPWCAMFASWCAMKAGIPEDKITWTASTSDFINWYTQQNRFESKNSDYIPKAGDLILYQWYEKNKKGEGRYDLVNGQYVYNENKTGMYDLCGHTGIVVAYEPANEEHEAYVYTIEGNHNDEHGVYFRQVSMNRPNLKGFGVNGGSSYGIIPPYYET